MNLINIRSTFNYLQKNKFHSLLNVFGLAVGLLFFFHLVSYLFYEKNYDKSFSYSELIYRVNYDVEQNGQNVTHTATTPRGLYQVLPIEIPEVESSAHMYLEKVLVRYNDKNFTDQPALWVEGDFTSIFDFKMIDGTPRLNDKFTCIVSQSMAIKIFGTENPIGKILYINEGMPHEITGLYEDLPTNSHIHCDFFMPVKTFIHYNWLSAKGDWTWQYGWTYLKIKKGTNQEILNAGLKNIADKYLTHLSKQQRKGTFVPQSLSMLHFSSGRTNELGVSTTKETISALYLIAGLILVVIWMNYINLSTALSQKRLNVIATFRKLGANKFQLFKLSLIASIMINLSAIGIAVLLYFLTQNAFDHLIGVTLRLGSIDFPKIIWVTAFILLAGIMVTSLISSIPALKTNLALQKQTNMSGNKSTKWLVGLQFFTSCVLIICSLMVTKQISYMQQADLGVELNQVIVLKGATSTNSHPHRRELFNAFRDEILQSPVFISGTVSMNVPGQPLRYRADNISISGKQSELKQAITIGNIDNGYIQTYGLKLLAGQNFDLSPHLDSAKVLISESTVNVLGFRTPAEAIGQQLRIGEENKIIKGVVNDFHHEGLKKTIEPMLFTHEHPYEFGYYSFRINGNVKQALANMTAIWSKHYPEDPLESFFSDTYFNQQYNNEVRLSRILSVFTLFAIIIASLGLFGMVSIIAQQRTKEIGIRKVNGAKISEILTMLNKDFVKLVMIAFVIAIPIAGYAMSKWLENFAYKTHLSWWIFAIAGLLALGIAFLTVSWQSWRAAKRNPVESLRHE